MGFITEEDKFMFMHPDIPEVDGVKFDEVLDSDTVFLYSLLEERMAEPHINISHNALPTIRQHIAFCASDPYKAWYVIKLNGERIGSVYLTKRDEVGIHIIKEHRHKRIGAKALEFIEKRFPGTKILANINPRNEKSLHFFEKHGYKILQVTYVKETSVDKA
jgi:RimJ/RimL family protein N-acetyltransferase